MISLPPLQFTDSKMNIEVAQKKYLVTGLKNSASEFTVTNLDMQSDDCHPWTAHNHILLCDFPQVDYHTDDDDDDDDADDKDYDDEAHAGSHMELEKCSPFCSWVYPSERNFETDG